MAAADMLDVLHFYFEGDSMVEEEFGKARREMRSKLYTTLYDRPYTWGVDTTREFGTQEVGVDPVTGESTEFVHHPYIPPTPVNATSSRPYGTAIDPPLG